MSRSSFPSWPPAIPTRGWSPACLRPSIEHGAASAAPGCLAGCSQRTRQDGPAQPHGRERAVARLEQGTTELAATSADITEARTIADRVLAVFLLRSKTGTPTTPSGVAALFEVDADQILRMQVFRDRHTALDAVKKRAQQPA
jgi:hypothetical protein